MSDAIPPLLRRVDHIGIAVHDLDAAVALYEHSFGIHSWERIVLLERHMAVAVCRIGDCMLELISPTSDEAAFARFLRERGEGLHHIAYEVDDVEAALRTVEGRGIRLVDAHGRPGIHDTCVAFLHPKATMGVLTELVQLPQAKHEGESRGS
ncbi:MAG TPA: methylmalonyl-CoA epimerase [Herpetosiphonaceae bacterium]|nr:methylmalonyl-CoA epimerase [Herpetosiphonaceae bacterium]